MIVRRRGVDTAQPKRSHAPVPIAQVLSTLVGAGSVGVAAYGLLRTASVNRKQTNSQLFLDCVKRYEKTYEAFPAALNSTDLLFPWLRV